MGKINLPIANGFYETDSPVISVQNCVNMYPVTEGVDSLNADTLRSIPGCEGVVDSGTFSTCVGAHVLNGTPYFVIGSKLWSMTSAGVLSDMGTLTGTGRPTFADNGTQLMICYAGDNGYIFTESPDTLTLISDADYTTTNGAPQAVVFIDGYFVCTTDDKKFIISSLNDGLTWNALDFGTAESSPDATVTPVVYKNQLFIGGESTLEAFSNLGGADFPFVRTGLFLDKGIYSPQTVVDAPNTFVFIGGGEDEIPAVWMFEGNSTKKISNRGIDKILREMTTAELDASYGWAYGQSGNYFIGFTLSDTTIVYDLTTSKWHERLSDYTAAASLFLCSALDTYIKAIPDVFGYGIFSNNKTSGNPASYDESGQSTPIYFETDINTSVIYDINDGAPSSCQRGILYQHVHNGSYSPNFGIPAHDVSQPAGWISGGAILKMTATNGEATQPLIAISKFRDASTNCSIWVDASLNLYVGSTGGTKYLFSAISAIEVQTWYFLHLAYHTGTGAFVARIDGNELTGTVPSGETILGAWSLGAGFYMNARGDTGKGKFFANILGYAVDGLDDGELAYAQYERTIPIIVTPGLVSGFSNTVESYTTALEYYWKLDELSGDAADSSTAALTIADVGSPTYNSGDIMNEAGAITFNGNSLFEAGGASMLSQLTLTIGVWLEVGDTSLGNYSETIIQSGNASNDRAWRLYFDSNLGRLILHNQTNNTYSFSDSGIVSTVEGAISFVTMTHTNGTAPEFFVNGVSAGLGDAGFSRGFPIGSANIYVGAQGQVGYANYMTGAMSKLFVISQLVPDDRILNMYNEGAL